MRYAKNMRMACSWYLLVALKAVFMIKYIELSNKACSVELELSLNLVE